MKHIAIFASGAGSNAKKIIEHFEHHPQITVSLIVSNKADAPVLDIARLHGIPSLVIDRPFFYHSEIILNKFNIYSIDFVVLAGFLWLAPAYLVRAFDRRMVNIHPALLPKFGGKGMFGMHVHEAVLAAKERKTGITIHYVNEQYDDGDIIFQASCPVENSDTPNSIAQKVHQLEHRYFPAVIEEVLTNQTR